MALTATASNHFKYALANKLVDLAADNIKAMLMRDGFVFNKDNHATLINVKATKAATTIAISAGLAITDSGNGFITAGFVPGNQITVSGFTEGGNNATKIISTVAAGTIVVTDTAGLVEEAAGDMVTVESNDEIVAENGYSAGGASLTSPVLTENDTTDKAVFTCADVDITATGGDLDPTPGAILYDNTNTEKTIIGYLDFDGDYTLVEDASLRLSNLKIETA